MKITVTGSVGNISRPLIQQLVENGHQVRVISSSIDRISEIEQLKASPFIGSVENENFVMESFYGSDAVYLMVPPNFSVPNYQNFTAKVGQNYARAVKQTGIRYVVNLSSSGSPLAGKPPLNYYQNLEGFLDELPEVHVLHLRPGGFYANFYGSMDMIKHQGIIGNNYPDHISLPMSDPADIADAAADALHSLSFQGKNIKYIVSDTKSGKEIARILGEAIGKSELKWVEFSDQQLLQGLLQQGFSEDAAQHYIVDMGVAIREGVLGKHYAQNAYEVVGKRSFAAFAQSFAKIYQHNYQ